jgi:hypothetical protein
MSRKAYVSKCEPTQRMYEYDVQLNATPRFVKTGEYDIRTASAAGKFQRLVTAIEASPLVKADLSGATDRSVARTLAEKFNS